MQFEVLQISRFQFLMAQSFDRDKYGPQIPNSMANVAYIVLNKTIRDWQINYVMRGRYARGGALYIMFENHMRS